MLSRKMMVVLALMVSMLGVGAVGCGASWFENLKKDPVTKVNSIVTAAQTTISMAQLFFNQLPDDVKDRFRGDFDDAMMVASRSLAVVQNGLYIYAEAKEDNPDFDKVFAELKAAVKHVVAIVAKAKGIELPDELPAPTADKSYGTVVSGDAQVDELLLHLSNVERF